MSYLQFLALFLAPPIAVLAMAVRRRLDRATFRILAVTAAAALVFTAPWDNAIILNGVWSFAPGRSVGIPIGVVPLEEYAFYALQVALTGLLTVWLLSRPPRERL